jgi:hypothetical protein
MQKKQPAGCFFVACDLLVGALDAAIRLGTRIDRPGSALTSGSINPQQSMKDLPTVYLSPEPLCPPSNIH